MKIEFATIMTWITLVKTGIWKVKKHPNKIDEDLVIKNFNKMFLNELYREATKMQGVNPYKGIDYISVILNNDKTTFDVLDTNGFLVACLEGIYNKRSNKILCFNINKRGVNTNYFSYQESENNDWVSVEKIINGAAPINSNVKRLINALFSRQEPYWAIYKNEDLVLSDYTDEEIKSFIEEFLKSGVSKQSNSDNH